jgi:hypothetical protein
VTRASSSRRRGRSQTSTRGAVVPGGGVGAAGGEELPDEGACEGCEEGVVEVAVAPAVEGPGAARAEAALQALALSVEGGLEVAELDGECVEGGPRGVA